jgi:hypothetical protein
MKQTEIANNNAYYKIRCLRPFIITIIADLSLLLHLYKTKILL